MGFQRKREILRKKIPDAIYKNPKVVEEGEELVENEESHSGVNMKIYSLTTWFLLVIFLYEGLLSVSAVTYVLTLLPFILLLAFTAKGLLVCSCATQKIRCIYNGPDYRCNYFSLVTITSCNWNGPTGTYQKFYPGHFQSGHVG